MTITKIKKKKKEKSNTQCKTPLAQLNDFYHFLVNDKHKFNEPRW